jgi:hypothetical protein
MATEPNGLRSRRALLAAAAGSAAAVVASAALPLTAAASPGNILTEQDNPTGATTSLTDNGANSTAFSSRATGSGAGFGVEGTSAGAAGLTGWSVAAPTSYWPSFTPSFTNYTGIFGSAPASPDGSDAVGTGVWGDSPDIGVYGSGSSGVVGFGAVGVEGDANSTAGSVGVRAFAPSTAQIALKVQGKVSLSRSGRTTMSSGTSSKAISLAGVTSSSKVFAVLASNRSGRYIRAIVPASGRFTVYLNTTLTSSAVVSWFVLD